MVCILIGTTHLPVSFILNKCITTRSASNNIPHQPHALHPPVPAHRLPERLVVGLAREVANEQRAVGVAVGLRVPKGIIEAGAGAEEGAEDGVVVRGDVRAVDASSLDRVVLLRVEHRAHAPAAHLSPADGCPPALLLAVFFLLIREPPLAAVKNWCRGGCAGRREEQEMDWRSGRLARSV